MSLNKTGIRGIVYQFRPGKKYDSFRVQLYNRELFGPEPKWLSPKVDPRVKQINEYLKSKGFHESHAEKDPDFLTMKHRLFADLQSEHSLKHYRGREKLLLQSKEFNFEESVAQFVESKMDTSVPMKHKAYLLNVWLPFYIDKGCKHPSQFIHWRKQAKMYVKTVKQKNSDEKYSANSWVSLTNTHNQYLKFLLENGDISDEQFFTIKSEITREARKRGLTSKSRKQDTYSLQDLFGIKAKIDVNYKDNLLMKLRAYGILIGVYTGLRKGNLLGLTAECLHPEAEVPHIETKDNHVPGWGRGIKGTVILENSTKTFVGTIALPMIQPSVEILIEVAQFLKIHLKSGDRIVNCSSRTVNDWWEAIANDCGFRYLTPHDWKHSYATIGGLHLTEWYDSNPYLLQKCCLHEKYETTLNYMKTMKESFLEAFRKTN